jgi:cytochrome c
LALASPGVPDELGDAARGEDIFKQCIGCHEVGTEARNRVGPHLNGVFGRTAGSVEGFRYSESMNRASGDGLVWDLTTLDAYLENPRVLVSGTRMSFRGLKDARDRGDVLAYLRQFSANPRDIPEAVPTALPSAPELDLPADVLAIEGDREWGEYLSSECKTCHQADGSAHGIPSITSWPEEDFVIAMHAYKRQLRRNPGDADDGGSSVRGGDRGTRGLLRHDRLGPVAGLGDTENGVRSARQRREEGHEAQQKVIHRQRRGCRNGAVGSDGHGSGQTQGGCRRRRRGRRDRGPLSRQGQRRRDRRHADRAERVYYTCFFSNLYIGGFQNLTTDLATPMAASPPTTVSTSCTTWVMGVDRDARTVTLASGGMRCPTTGW